MPLVVDAVFNDPGLGATARIATIAISPQNDNVRIVGLEDGKVFRTTTGGALTDVTPPLFGAPPGPFVGRVVIDPNNANTAYVAYNGFGLAAGQHVWKTTNLSASPPTWVAAGGSGANLIPDVPVNAFAVDPTNSQRIFAGTDIGVYSSTDGGTTWAPLGTGLPRVAVFDMAIQSPNRVLRIATHGRGWWEIDLPGAVVSTPTPTATPASTATPTLTPSPTLSPTPTATPFPKPNVGVQVAPNAGTLQTTISARDAGCNNNTQNNQLLSLQFTRLTNATVDVATSPVTTVTTPTTVALPLHPATIQLTVRRVTAGQAATVELTVTDGCGSWPTLVGGGPNAF